MNEHPREHLIRLLYYSGATDETIVRYLRGTGVAFHPLDSGPYAGRLRDFALASRCPGLVQMSRWCDYLEDLITQQNLPIWSKVA